MHKVISFALILTLAITGKAQTSVLPRFVQEWKAYTDSATNITVKYPESWTLKTTNEKTIFILKSPVESEADSFNENLNMIVRVLPNGGDGVNFEQIAEAVESKIWGAVDNFVLYYSKNLKWDGNEAKEVSYGGNSKTNGSALKFTQRITLHQGRMILVTYTFEGGTKTDIYGETVQKIINGIKFN